MHFQAARGGEKPRMLQTGEDLPITVRNNHKVGIYELSINTSILARRVELPIWLSQQWKNYHGGMSLLGFIQMHKYDMPRSDVGESRGHIFLSPPPHLFDGPAVGLDMEIWHKLLESPKIRLIQFHVYGECYEQFATWSVPAEDFIDQCRHYMTQTFSPQMMVSLSELTEGRGFQYL